MTGVWIGISALAVAAMVLQYWLHDRERIRQRNQVSALQDENRTLVASIPAQRKAAVRKSRAVNTGLITQDMAPLLPDWPYALKDTRYAGAPLDYIVFKGMDDGEVEKIVFVEVKSGGSKMTPRQRQIMKAIRDGRVEYVTYSPGGATIDSSAGPVQELPAQDEPEPGTMEAQ